jgi:hypothetical protein
MFFGRQKPFASLIGMGLLISFNLVTLFLGKSLDKSLLGTCVVYLISHPILWICSYLRVERLSKGTV